MSFEEDIELKNLVAQTLENKGILPKIRAELRANVFLALEENPATKETLLKNDELSAFVKIPLGTLILNLVREFLEFFELEFTLSVFDPETKYGKEYNSIAKEKMMKELKITECKKKNPLLYEVIERLIGGNESNVLNGEKVDLSQGDISGSGDSENFPSPIVLNSTFVKKKPEVESAPVSPIDKEEKEEENDSIKESISNNISESDSLGVDKLNLGSSSKIGNNEDLSNGSIKEVKVNSPKPAQNPVEIDLLTFTPVKESKLLENTKSSNMKSVDKKESQKSLSALGDLPPLTSKVEEREDKITQIKAIIDKWPGLENEEEPSIESRSSKDQNLEQKSALKSDRSDHSQNMSHKTDKTESVEDFEEDISDLINGHTPSDGQLTIDETISKVSSAADYLESL